MNFEETLQYLYAALPMYQRVGAAAYKKDLGNIELLCAALDNPQNKFKSIHVAGTNGKGSSSHMLAAALQANGYKTGLYTSPHLKSFTERIRVNGIEIYEQEVVKFVEANKELIEHIKPSFFEITVAMAFYLFAKEQVDIAVVEVGLGGRLDSTNMIMPEVCLITNISFDHEHMLGNTLPLIAKEKAGIIKQGVPVVIGQKQPETVALFIEHAKEKHADIFFASDRFHVEQASAELLNVIQDNEVFLEGLNLDVKGRYQQDNLLGVLEVLQILSAQGMQINEAKLQSGLENVAGLTGLKGRWQILSERPWVICDTGHNEAGLTAILEQINATPHDNLFMILGAVNDKALDTMLQLLPVNANYFFCQADIPRALDAHVLAKKADEYGLNGEVIKNVNEALQLARSRAKDKDLIFIGGSTFVVAELEEL